MARLASRQVAGYYPLPPALLPALASGFSLAGKRQSYGPALQVLDPCAGEGTAALGLASALAATDSTWSGPSVRLTAIELEGSRADLLADRCGKPGEHPRIQTTTHRGDALTAQIRGQFDLLYLNPPYDTDPEFDRLELRFLARLTPALSTGTGWLLLVIPTSALTDPLRRFLDSQYTDLEIRRFPDSEFAAFRQVVVRGRRRMIPVDLPDRAAEALLRDAAAGDPSNLQDLVGQPWTPVQFDELRGEPATVAMIDVDLAALAAAYRPWHRQERLLGLDRSLDHLLSSPQRITLPPKPAHLALALSTGLLNGHALVADRPDLFPRILVKGALERTYEFLKSSRREDGSLASAQYTQVPRLVLNALRLDTRSILTIRPGAVPTGSADMSEWNTADLATQYSASLARVLREILPALHDPTGARGSVPYPPLDRKLFAIQDAALQASLKLLASGETPLLLGEVGTGKSTVALTLARLLEPESFTAAVAALERLGFPARRNLRPVRSTLILCPPHLVSSWQEQIDAVRPWSRVQVLENATDVDQPAEIYLLSRETAKLDAKIVGLTGMSCPRCGRLGDPELRAPETRAQRRARCENVIHPNEQRHPLVDPLVALTLSLAGLFDFSGGGTLGTLVGRRVSGFAGQRILEATSLDEVGRSAAARAGADRVSDLLAGLVGSVNGEASSPPSNLDLQPFRVELEALRIALESCRRGSREGRERMQSLLFKLLHRAIRESERGQGVHCSEALFSRAPSPRRTPLARHVLRRLKGRIDLLVIDEAQEFEHGESAQARAAWRLTSLGCPTLLLSGSIMNGYSSSLFPALWATRQEFREHFDRNEEARFVEQYGYQRVSLNFKPGETARTLPQTLGAMSDAVLDAAAGQRVQEAPGVTPQMLVRHLMPVAIAMHKQDLDEALPDLDEIRVPIEACSEPSHTPHDTTLLKDYEEVTQRVIRRLNDDKENPERRGALWGALAQLVYAPELTAEDCGPYEVRYPERLNRELVTTAAAFPTDLRTPKERWLVETVASELAAKRPVIVFVQSSGHHRFVERLARLLESCAPGQVIALDAQKVDAKRRKAWIDRHVVAARKNVLLVNPNAVKTGLNNLVRFQTGIWYQIPDFNVLVTRQANGRLHRIGQKHDVRIYYPYYRDTLQEAAMTLVARKMSASLQVDGLSLQSALEASGAGGSAEVAASSFTFGEALVRLYTAHRREQPAAAAAPRQTAVFTRPVDRAA